MNNRILVQFALILYTPALPFMTHQVYIIENKQARIYIGISENVEKRLSDHNAGISKWTKKFRPWNILWTSYPMTLSEARKLENKMKRQKGGNGLNTLREIFKG